MTEEDVQKRIRYLLETLQFNVYDLSQGFRPSGPRHATTRQTQGIGDLFAFAPIGDEWRGATVWIEVKAITAKEALPHLNPKDRPWREIATRVKRGAVGHYRIDETRLRAMMNETAFYDLALMHLGEAKRLEIYQRKRSREQEIFGKRCTGRQSLLYILGGIEEVVKHLDGHRDFCQHVGHVREVVVTDSAKRYLTQQEDEQ